jgi:hypothetical protein
MLDYTYLHGCPKEDRRLPPKTTYTIKHDTFSTSFLLNKFTRTPSLARPRPGSLAWPRWPGLAWPDQAWPGWPGLALRPGKGKFVVFLVDFWRGQLASHLGAEIAIWAMRDAKKCCVLSMKLVLGPAGAPAWDIHANACAPKWAIAGSESTVFYR